MELLRWFILLLAIFWVIWFLTGGPQSGNISQPFLRPPAPLDTGETYGELPLPPGVSPRDGNGADGRDSSDENKIPSIFKGNVGLQMGSPRATSAGEEYIEMFASYSNTQPVNITDWVLKSAITGRSATIGKGVYLPFSGLINTEENIFLNPGDRVIITTGHSKTGISFRLNTCTGYFEQFQDFTPALPQQCPRPIDENLSLGQGGLNDACVDYIEQIPACFAHIKAIPVGLSLECNEFINRNVHYNGCLALHKNDSNFYKQEWRIFLKKDAELWKEKRETIKLLDAEGKIIDSLSY